METKYRYQGYKIYKDDEGYFYNSKYNGVVRVSDKSVMEANRWDQIIHYYRYWKRIREWQ